MSATNGQVVRDIAELGKGLEAWSAVYEQMTPGAFEGQIREIWIDDGIELLWERGSQSVFTYGTNSAGMVSIGVLVPPERAGLCCGVTLSGDTVACLPGGEAFEIFSRGVMDIISATIRETLLDEFSEACGDRRHAGLSRQGPTILVHPRTAALLRRTLVEIMRALEIRPSLLSFAASRKAMRDCVLSLMLGPWGENARRGAEVRHPSVKGWLVRGARQYVLDRPGEPVTVADLCLHFGVSRRTLQYAFEELAGIGIVQFLRSVRLNGVRRDLITGTQNTRIVIADVAAHWGFWHLPRFSAYYRTLFGELPSDTRRRASGP